MVTSKKASRASRPVWRFVRKQGFIDYIYVHVPILAVLSTRSSVCVIVLAFMSEMPTSDQYNKLV